MNRILGSALSCQLYTGAHFISTDAYSHARIIMEKLELILAIS